MKATIPIDNPERLRLERQHQGQENWRLWGRILRSGPGARCARTTAPTAKPGNISTTTNPVPASTAGTRTVWGGICDEQQWLCFALALVEMVATRF